MFAVFGPVILAALLVIHGGVIAVGDGEGGAKESARNNAVVALSVQQLTGLSFQMRA